MKRILTILVVALVMAAMLVVMAAPAFADPIKSKEACQDPKNAKKVEHFYGNQGQCVSSFEP